MCVSHFQTLYMLLAAFPRCPPSTPLSSPGLLERRPCCEAEYRPGYWTRKVVSKEAHNDCRYFCGKDVYGMCCLVVVVDGRRASLQIAVYWVLLSCARPCSFTEAFKGYWPGHPLDAIDVLYAALAGNHNKVQQLAGAGGAAQRLHHCHGAGRAPHQARGQPRARSCAGPTGASSAACAGTVVGRPPRISL